MNHRLKRAKRPVSKRTPDLRHTGAEKRSRAGQQDPRYTGENKRAQESKSSGEYFAVRSVIPGVFIVTFGISGNTHFTRRGSCSLQTGHVLWQRLSLFYLCWCILRQRGCQSNSCQAAEHCCRTGEIHSSHRFG